MRVLSKRRMCELALKVAVGDDITRKRTISNHAIGTAGVFDEEEEEVDIGQNASSHERYLPVRG